MSNIQKGAKNSLSYTDIAKGLKEGLSIAQQYERFGVSNTEQLNGKVVAIRKKVMRVYNVDFALHGKGKEPTDPYFVRMHVNDGTFWDILDLIQN